MAVSTSFETRIVIGIVLLLGMDRIVYPGGPRVNHFLDDVRGRGQAGTGAECDTGVQCCQKASEVTHKSRPFRDGRCVGFLSSREQGSPLVHSGGRWSGPTRWSRALRGQRGAYHMTPEELVVG